VPTSVKKADRNALRCGPAPSSIRCGTRQFDAEEGQTKAQGEDQPADQALLAALHRDHGKAIGDRREQQHRGVERHQRQVEQVLGRRTPA
jgi:hypothetical protein